MRARRLRRARLDASLALGGAALLTLAVGFVRIAFEPAGPGFHWVELPVRYVIHEAGSEDVVDGSDHAAVELALARWEAVEESSAAFERDAAADDARTDYDMDDIHLVIWDEDGSSGLFPPGSGVLALTPILATLSDGEILDADIVLNGAFTFTTDPAEHPDRFDVQSVVTHEAGHMLGFDHAGGPLATLYSAIPAGTVHTRALTRDEVAAASTVYPSGPTTTGRIQGRVTVESAGVRFGHVVAIDAGTGEYAADAITDGDGDYVLDGVPAGSYTLYAEPLDGPLHTDDTVSLHGELASDFGTSAGTSASVGAGGVAAADIVAAAASGLNVSGGVAVTLEPGEQGLLQLSGSGLDEVVEVTVTGAGVSAGALTASATRLTVGLSASGSATPGVRCILVRTGDGERALLAAAVRVVAPPPLVESVSPPSGLDPAGGDLLVVRGQGFTAGTEVVLGGRRASDVEVVDATELRCLAPAAGGTDPLVDLVVVRPDGQEGRLRAATRYDAIPVPTAVDPAIGSVLGGTVHQLVGSGFFTGAQVFFGEAEAEVLSVTGSALEVRLPPAAAPGVVDLRVVQNAEEGLLTGAFRYVDGTPPLVDALSPTIGPTRGGTRVTIVGSGFASEPDGVEVSFGGVPAEVRSAGEEELVVTAPAHEPGAVLVRVRDLASGLETIAARRFTYSDEAQDKSGGGGGGGCTLALPHAAAGGWWLAPLLLLAGLTALRGLARPR